MTTIYCVLFSAAIVLAAFSVKFSGYKKDMKKHEKKRRLKDAYHSLHVRNESDRQFKKWMAAKIND